MRFFLLIILLSAANSVVFSQNLPQRSLEDCIRQALDHNAELQRSFIVAKHDDIRHLQSHLNRLPTVSASLGHGFNQGRSVDPITNQYTEETFGYGSQSLSASMNLFNGLRTLHEIRRQASARKAGQLEYQNQAHELRLDVIEAYIAVLTSRDLREQAQRQLDVTAEQLRRAEVMHEEGSFPPGDFFDIKGQYKRDENQIENSEKTYYASRLRLSRLMGIAETELGEMQDLHIQLNDRQTDQVQLFELAQSLPHIQALDFRINEARHQLRSAKGSFFPSLSFNAGLSSNYSNKSSHSYTQQFNNNLGKYVSFGLSIPIFNRLQTLNQVKHARLTLQEYEWIKKGRLEDLLQVTSQAVFDLQYTIGQVRNLEEQVEFYAESFRIAQVHFDAGASNSFQLLAAKNKMDSAHQELVLKKYEYLMQQYINDYYSGSLDF